METEAGKAQDSRMKEAMRIAEELRSQLSKQKATQEDELKAAKKASDKAKATLLKEKTELERKLREAEEGRKVLEIDRRNALSNKDEGEAEKVELQGERDSLLQRLHDSEIHQLANKYKLDKVADQLSDCATKIKYAGALPQTEKKEMEALARKALEQLLLVRDDLAKTKALNADAISIASQRSLDHAGEIFAFSIPIILA